MTSNEEPIGNLNYGSAIRIAMNYDRGCEDFRFLCPNAGIMNMASLPSELFKSIKEFNFAY
jgi:hypothetical protein